MAQIIRDIAKDGKNSDAVTAVLNAMAEDLEKNPPEDTRGGHDKLMQDLAELLQEAHEFEFDDFRNKKYSSPKIVLFNKLNELASNVKNGKYDN